MFNKFLLIATAVMLLSCSGSNEQDVYLKDLGKRTVGIYMSNKFYYNPSLRELIKNREDKKLLLEVMDIASTIDTLAGTYFEQSGGMNPADGTIHDINASGVRGVKLFNAHNIKKKVIPMLERVRNLETAESKGIVDAVGFILDDAFLGVYGSFSEEKLQSTPYPMLSLELSLIENNIYSCILEHIAKNPEKTE